MRYHLVLIILVLILIYLIQIAIRFLQLHFHKYFKKSTITTNFKNVRSNSSLITGLNNIVKTILQQYQTCRIVVHAMEQIVIIKHQLTI